MAELDDVREAVRARYATAAQERSGCGCGPGRTEASLTDEQGSEVFGSVLYGEQAETGTEDAIDASLGCGVPTAVADLHAGEVVLDLGSGAGADVLISARRVGPTGKAIGLDMTDEMLELARGNAERAGVSNVEFVKGYLEELPLADGSVDVVISNCVINLSGDKTKVISEAARVLRPGGRFAVSDVIADPNMDDATRRDMRAWTGCIAGALTEDEFRATLTEAGFEEIEIRETHRVHAHAGAAIIRARRPSARGELPLIQDCALDERELAAQLARYRTLAGHVTGIERTAGHLAVQLDPATPAELIARTIEIERGCCSFYELDYDAARRRLTIRVDDPALDRRVDLLAAALTAPAPPAPSRSSSALRSSRRGRRC